MYSSLLPGFSSLRKRIKQCLLSFWEFDRNMIHEKYTAVVAEGV